MGSLGSFPVATEGQSSCAYEGCGVRWRRLDRLVLGRSWHGDCNPIGSFEGRLYRCSKRARDRCISCKSYKLSTIGREPNGACKMLGRAHLQVERLGSSACLCTDQNKPAELPPNTRLLASLNCEFDESMVQVVLELYTFIRAHCGVKSSKLTRPADGLRTGVG